MFLAVVERVGSPFNKKKNHVRLGGLAADSTYPVPLRRNGFLSLPTCARVMLLSRKFTLDTQHGYEFDREGIPGNRRTNAV